MRFSLLTTRILAAITVFSVASVTHSDTLELQNGEILDGVFKGGTQNTIRFSSDGSLRTIPVADVLALTISRESAAVPEVEEMPLEEVAPVAEPAPVVEPRDILAPAGSPLLVRFIDEIDSRKHEVGHRFAVKLEADFIHNGRVIAPMESKLYGVLVDAKQAGRIKGKTHLTLALTEIRIDGELHPLVTGEYNLAGKKSSGKRSALKVLGGAALGAVVHHKDRGKGAAVGAGVGLGASAITRGEQITVPKNTLIEFRLGAPFTL